MSAQWHQEAHELWNKGSRAQAIDCVVAELNSHSEPKPKPKPLLMQFSYYLFLLGDYTAAARVLQDAASQYPNDDEVLANWVVTLSRAGAHSDAVEVSKRALAVNADNFIIYDALAKSYYKLGRLDMATHAGDQSLALKSALVDDASASLRLSWRLPSETIEAKTRNKKQVIAFSLFGTEQGVGKEYLNGAVRNAVLALDLYADWEIWIYHDDSVPANLLELLAGFGAVLKPQPSGQSQKLKLCWRFQVADSPEVGFFLVRDIDSVFSLRERMAVQEWLESGKWFHTIHDWWTHTDLILAGLWGGVAGVLPNVWRAVNDYFPATLSTPNIDQWFLRDRIWPFLQQSCLMHDRCYRKEMAQPIPGPQPVGNQHIGSSEFRQSAEDQRRLVAPWLSNVSTINR